MTRKEIETLEDGEYVTSDGEKFTVESGWCKVIGDEGDCYTFKGPVREFLVEGMTILRLNATDSTIAMAKRIIAGNQSNLDAFDKAAVTIVAKSKTMRGAQAASGMRWTWLRKIVKAVERSGRQ